MQARNSCIETCLKSFCIHHEPLPGWHNLSSTHGSFPKKERKEQSDPPPPPHISGDTKSLFSLSANSSISKTSVVWTPASNWEQKLAMWLVAGNLCTLEMHQRKGEITNSGKENFLGNYAHKPREHTSSNTVWDGPRISSQDGWWRCCPGGSQSLKMEKQVIFPKVTFSNILKIYIKSPKKQGDG